MKARLSKSKQILRRKKENNLKLQKIRTCKIRVKNLKEDPDNLVRINQERDIILRCHLKVQSSNNTLTKRVQERILRIDQ